MVVAVASLTATAPSHISVRASLSVSQCLIGTCKLVNTAVKSLQLLLVPYIQLITVHEGSGFTFPNLTAGRAMRAAHINRRGDMALMFNVRTQTCKLCSEKNNQTDENEMNVYGRLCPADRFR